MQRKMLKKHIRNRTGKVTVAECSVEMGESIRLIAKEDGRIVSPTDADHPKLLNGV